MSSTETSTPKTASFKSSLDQMNGLFGSLKDKSSAAYTDLTKYVKEYKTNNPDSKITKSLEFAEGNKKSLLVAASALGLLSSAGSAFKKYQNIKMTKIQKEKIEAVKKEKMAVLKAELKKSKLSASRKKKIMMLFLLSSIGAIILGSKVKSLKKGGSNKKKTLKK